MDKSKREMYLEKIETETSTVGVEMPDSMKINGTEYPVNDILFELSSNNKLPNNVNISKTNFKTNVIRERQDLIELIESKDISEQKAKNTVTKINQIDRIINALKDENTSFKNKVKRNKAKKTAKWRNYIKQINDDI